MKRKLLLLAALIVITITACKMYYTPQKPAYTAGSSPEMVMHGKHLVSLMCAPCHYDPATKKLTGIRMVDVPKMIGKLYASNITQHPSKGMGSYTDGELAYLLRTGIARNGKLMPYMQKPNLADDDLKAIIAFLRSNDEMVQASDAEPGRTKYTLMGKFGVSHFSKPLPYPSKDIPLPNTSDKVSFGRYLVDNLSCYDCHSASFTAVSRTEPEKSKGYMGGGNKLKDQSGATVISSNLTPHETGLGSWTEKDFVRAMKDGVSKDNSIVRYPMPMFTELSDEELSAIYAYLKSIPPIDNKIKK